MDVHLRYNNSQDKENCKESGRFVVGSKVGKKNFEIVLYGNHELREKDHTNLTSQLLK